MKHFFSYRLIGFCVSTFCFSATSWAQGEFLNNSNTIAPSGSSLTIPSVSSPSVFSLKNKTEKKASPSILEPNKIQFTQNNSFSNPGDLVKDKLIIKESGFDSQAYRKNQYFGDLKSKSAFVRISCRDFGEVDGDEIRVWVNDRVIIDRIYLDSDFQRVELGLEKGFNKIDFEALNQGFSGPNTAQFQIYDDNGQLMTSNQWNLATGFKATIIIVKD